MSRPKINSLSSHPKNNIFSIDRKSPVLHLRLDADKILLLEKLALKYNTSISFFVRYILDSVLTKPNYEQYFEDVFKNIKKNQMRKKMTESFHDQFLFKNGTRSIFNIAYWQNERMKYINMGQIWMNIDEIIKIYEELPDKIKLHLSDEKIEFEKLKDEAYLRTRLHINKRLKGTELYKKRKKYVPALESGKNDE
jgi:hypothetical protein